MSLIEKYPKLFIVFYFYLIELNCKQTLNCIGKSFCDEINVHMSPNFNFMLNNWDFR